MFLVANDQLSPWFFVHSPCLTSATNMSFGGPPMVCCFQARTVIIFFSITGFFVCVWQVLTCEDRASQVTGVFCSVSEVILLYGVVKHVSHLLRISMFISLINVTLDFGTILVSPVYFASQTASGFVSIDTYPVFQIIMIPDIEKEDRFVAGLVTGYTVTVISTVLLFLSILEFVLINRCYVYTKMMEDAVFKRNNVMKF